MSKETDKAWKAANPEKVRGYRRKWAEANPEKQKESAKASHEAHPETHKKATQKYNEIHHERNLARYRRYKKEGKDYIEQQKAGKVCSMCHKEADPRKLLFHHVDSTTKLFSVGAHSSQSIQSIADEIAKCVIICRPCHIRHHRPGDGNKKKSVETA